MAIPLGDRTGLSHGIVGGVFTAVSTSIPELVVAITAVRMGALNLAVGDIIGGNAFDTLFIAASDFAYRDGPIYAAVSSAEQFWLANSMVMTSVLLMGLIYRERHGPGNIGLESVILLALYFGGACRYGSTCSDGRRLRSRSTSWGWARTGERAWDRPDSVTL